MKITVGTNELEVRNAYANRLASGKILVIVEALQELISHDELRAMFKGITEDLVITKDDGTKETFGGCHYAVKVADDIVKVVTNGVETQIEIHRAEIECSSEADFQLGRLRGDVTNHSQTLNLYGNAINEHTTVINAQVDAIGNQQKKADVLTEQSSLQSDALDVIISEVIPMAIEVAIESAVTKMKEQFEFINKPTEEDVVEDADVTEPVEE